MITQTGQRSRRRGRDSLFRIAAGALILAITGCAEVEVGAEAYKSLAQANQPPAAPPVAPAPDRQDSIDPSMRPDREAFFAADLALWDGAKTLSGIWIAHPMARTARRVRLTNGETGARVDAAMFRRDPKLSGPRIVVSSEAARQLGLAPGRGTPITIEGLAYRSGADTEAAVAGAAEEPAPVPAEVPAGEIVAEPAEPEATPVAALSPAPPAAPEPAPADTAGAEAAEPAPEDARPVAGTPAEAAPATAPDGIGDITDGRHFIQAGVFGQPGEAARQVERLRAADLPANELAFTLGERQLTRVLVGPYKTIAERDSALEAVRELGPADATPARG